MRWSPLRPAIVFTARADGVIDVWDLLDSAHKPESFSVADRLTTIELWQGKEVTHTQLIAAADAGGKVRSSINHGAERFCTFVT